jgi:hypothetical protein
MKRYTLKTDVAVQEDMMTMRRNVCGVSVMEEDDAGQWVRWSDVEALREHLEAQIPERRIAKLERALGLVSAGKCPECGQATQNYKPPLGSFAPEAFATLREQGIDPSTGHKCGCSLSHNVGAQAPNETR